MKKIRNINVQGNVFSYAGPVGGGRSSRKSPESYSSASPPVSFNSVINLLLKKVLNFTFIVLFAGLMALGLTGCQQPAEEIPPETEIPEPGNPQPKGGPLSKVITVNDVDTPQMLTGYDQSLADGFFRNLQSGLIAQTAFMMNSTGKLADNIRDRETNMNKTFRMTQRGENMLNEIDNRYMNLINELCILREKGTRDAYKAKVTAYLDAVQINHRNPSIMLNKNSAAATLIQEMQRNGVLPNGAFTLESAITALETVLVRDMPEEAGQTGYNLLQQLTDFAEIHGLADDVTALGFSLSPTRRSVSAPTRESIAAAEGIVK